MGAAIDLICAKKRRRAGKYYKANGLGIAASLWNLPFNDGMFSSVCSNAGLEECREIPTVLAEAARVLAPKGRLVIRCLLPQKSLWYAYFEKYGFTFEEAREWLQRVRLFADINQVKELLTSDGLSLIGQPDCDRLGHIIVFEK